MAVLGLTAAGTDAEHTRADQDFATWLRTINAATDAARTQLQSDDPREIAWGAFRTAEYRLNVLAPDIASAIARAPAGFVSSDQSAMVSALFDAAVQVETEIPAPVLKRFWRTFPVQTSLLFARATGDRDAMLLELAASAEGYRWFAVANALLEARTHGFAALLLPHVRFRLLVFVTEGAGRGGGEGCGIHGSVSDGIGANPDGFPPVALYTFEFSAGNGNGVLSTGPMIVYYSRRVENGPQYGVWSHDLGAPTDDDIFRYVAALAGPRWAGTSRRSSQSLRWHDVAHLITDVAALKASAEDRYRALVKELRAAGQLSPEEAPALSTPVIDIEIVDLRDDKSIPLPEIR